ncbi:MAG TPA: plastocyanin/azurin family copper-binding protein [Verrucomicrobiae bacterium]|nr:plastocyanin/azurin family copper-binding protein [Verrucomicrobiae bacterium]
MKNSRTRFSGFCIGLFALAVFALPPAAHAQWRATVGGESKDMGKQALAFLPNEIWIHAGDSITWAWQSDEIHTLTFLTAGQHVPPFQVGCPGFVTSSATFDGSACVTTPPMVKGQTFTVTFPKAGSYKFECLVHQTMTGTVHVLDLSQPLPHSQKFYDDQAAKQRTALLTDIDQKMKMDMSAGDDGMSVNVFPRTAHVTAGVGEINATPGGYQTASEVRFINGNLTIHVGETVEWSNHDPLEPHTITFGFGNADPADIFDPTPNVTIDADGALHAIITLPTDKVSSGFLEQPFEDETGIPANPIVNPNNPATNISNVALSNPSRFRATFTRAGVYNYKCLLHDDIGMVGKIIVQP